MRSPAAVRMLTSTPVSWDGDVATPHVGQAGPVAPRLARDRGEQNFLKCLGRELAGYGGRRPGEFVALRAGLDDGPDVVAPGARGRGPGRAGCGDAPVGVGVQVLDGRTDTAGGQERHQLGDVGREAVALHDPPRGGPRQRFAVADQVPVAERGSPGPFVGGGEVVPVVDEVGCRGVEFAEPAALVAAAAGPQAVGTVGGPGVRPAGLQVGVEEEGGGCGVSRLGVLNCAARDVRPGGQVSLGQARGPAQSDQELGEVGEGTLGGGQGSHERPPAADRARRR